MTQSPKQMETQEVLRIKLKALKSEHRELDEEIKQIEETRAHDLLIIRRLKKKKLHLKDQITAIEDKLTPDLIA